MSDDTESPEQTAQRMATEQPPDDGDTEAAAGGDPQVPDVYIGPPFAVGAGVTIVEAEAVVEDEQGSQYTIDLLSDKYKRAPGGGPRMTHLLVVAPDDDEQIVSDVSGHIMYANELVDSSPLLEDDEGDEEE